MLLYTLACALHKPIDAQPIDMNTFDADRLSTLLCLQSNKSRALHFRTKLPQNELLTQAAQLYAKELQKDLFFDHEHPFEAHLRRPKDRVRAVGGNNPNVSENIAKGLVFLRTVGVKGAQNVEF